MHEQLSLGLIWLPIWQYKAVIAHAQVDQEHEHLAAHRWYLNPAGYVFRRPWVINSKRTWLHREVMGLEGPPPPDVDHINGDKLDNRRSNLRLVTHAQNCQNVLGRTGVTSKYRGVNWDSRKRKWVAQTNVDGRKVWIGRFDTEEEAAEAARAMRAKHMPFANEDRSVRL